MATINLTKDAMLRYRTAALEKALEHERNVFPGPGGFAPEELVRIAEQFFEFLAKRAESNG